MATNKSKKAATSNSGRNNRKAWKKSHDAPLKVVSQATLERRARHAAKKAKKGPQSPPGSNYTMPDFDYEWATEQMYGRSSHTRRARIVAICLAEASGKPAPVPTMVEQARTPHPRKSEAKVGAKR